MTDHGRLFLWSTVDYVGCGASYVDYVNEEGLERFNVNLVCYFGSSTQMPRGRRSAPFEVAGNPCQFCPEHLKCNLHFTGLCGEIFPADRASTLWDNYFWNDARDVNKITIKGKDVF